MYKIVVAAAAVLAAASGASAAITSSEAARLTSAAVVVDEIRAEIPQEYWTRARCVAVIPDLKKAAFIFGERIRQRRHELPRRRSMERARVHAAREGELGLPGRRRAGGRRAARDERAGRPEAAAEQGDAWCRRVRGGRADRAARHVGTDAALTAEILSYSRAQGLFAGIDLSGGVLPPDEDANTDVYGPRASPRTVLASREISAPPQASPFLKALGAAGSGTARPTDRAAAAPPSPAGGVAATSRTTTMPTIDEDLRARVVDIQQTLDRILADTTRAPVGTAGTAGGSAASGTVSVGRARSLQLRQQLDALLATLNKR